MGRSNNNRDNVSSCTEIPLSQHGVFGFTIWCLKVLNKELQPILERISKIYDNYGIGYYSIDLDSVVAIAPNFNPSLLQRIPRSYPYFKSYETGKPEYVYSGTSIGWYGKSIYAITYPIYRNDKIIGHTWANYKMEDIYIQAREQSRNIFLYGFIILIIVYC